MARELPGPGRYRDLVTAGASRPAGNEVPGRTAVCRDRIRLPRNSVARSVCHARAAAFADDGPGLPVADRVPDRLCPVGLGVLTGEISPGMVDEVIGLCLFSGADSMGPPGYRSVMRWLTNGLRHLDGVALPASSALTRARQRLGVRSLELLFGLRRGALAVAGTPGAFAFGLRLVAWDGDRHRCGRYPC